METHFIVHRKFNINELKEGEIIDTSDYFTHDAEGNAVQLKLVEKEKGLYKYDVKPGLFKIDNDNIGFKLTPMSFVHDKILEQFDNTKHIQYIAETFMSSFDIYYEEGFEIPKRSVLLYGPPGTGKSVAISRVVEKYINDGRTLAITWDTDKYEAYDVKNFIASFNYIDVDKIIFIMEDLGGTSNNESIVRSDSSLLALLDNNSKTFSKPVLIIATTNFIHNLEQNLVNRSGRFDDKCEIGYPNAQQRFNLLNFFAKSKIQEDDLNESIAYIQTKACEAMTPAHIREAYIRCRIRKTTLLESLKFLTEDVKKAQKGYIKSSSVGI